MIDISCPLVNPPLPQSCNIQWLGKGNGKAVGFKGEEGGKQQNKSLAHTRSLGKSRRRLHLRANVELPHQALRPKSAPFSLRHHGGHRRSGRCEHPPRLEAARPRLHTIRTGGDKGSRTPDLLNAIETLYQLSYIPVSRKRDVVYQTSG